MLSVPCRIGWRNPQKAAGEGEHRRKRFAGAGGHVWARGAHSRDCHRKSFFGGALFEGKNLTLRIPYLGFLLHERSKECFFCIVFARSIVLMSREKSGQNHEHGD
jgi:hypothetical protein